MLESLNPGLTAVGSWENTVCVIGLLLSILLGSARNHTHRLDEILQEDSWSDRIILASAIDETGNNFTQLTYKVVF